MNQMDDEIAFENTFRSYWAAYLTRRNEPGFRYEPFVNFVYFPRFAGHSDALLNYLHEFSHAQLNNGVLGITLFHLQKLPSLIEKKLFDTIRPHLEAFRSGKIREEVLFKELYLFGENGEKSGHVEDLFNDLRNSMASTSFPADFFECFRIFQLLNSRRKGLFRHWIDVHEGYASCASILLATDPDDFGADIRRDALNHFWPELTGHERVEIERGASLQAARLRENYLALSSPKSRYARGFQMFHKIFEEYGHPVAVHIAACAASHFPYHCCPLVDLSKEEFEHWLSGPLNPKKRLHWIATNEGCLRPLIEELKDRGQIASEAMRTLLSRMPECGELCPLGNEFRILGRWLERYLWRSKLFCRVIKVSDESFFGPDGRHEFRRVEEDKSTDFRHGEVFTPTVIHESGVIDGLNRLATMKNFVDFYEVERTSRLLNLLFFRILN